VFQLEAGRGGAAKLFESIRLGPVYCHQTAARDLAALID
jgi:hypothetical protein